MIKSIIFCLLLVPTLSKAQTDWVKWDAVEVSYKISNASSKNIITQKQNTGSGIISFLRNIYGFFISELDGDNCPFYPSCSHFFVQAISESGMIKGPLMFADRFIRDLNFFKGKNSYPIHRIGKFYDPVSNYTLNEQMIEIALSGNGGD
ncbi:MAG: membrane protein insertion efficiency factor YidD [Melioribacter sp.]|nr:membrane protein insertion efficiency factor YidD [Melioribacter sp.]